MGNARWVCQFFDCAIHPSEGYIDYLQSLKAAMQREATLLDMQCHANDCATKANKIKTNDTVHHILSQIDSGKTNIHNIMQTYFSNDK